MVNWKTDVILHALIQVGLPYAIIFIRKKIINNEPSKPSAYAFHTETAYSDRCQMLRLNSIDTR